MHIMIRIIPVSPFRYGTVAKALEHHDGLAVLGVWIEASASDSVSSQEDSQQIAYKYVTDL